MALNRPFGVAPYRGSGGNLYAGAYTRYCIPVGDGSAYYVNDMVKQVAGGDASGVPNVQKAAGTDTMRGFIVGIENPTIGGPSIQGTVLDDTVVNIPATKTRAYYVYVDDNPHQLFMVQDDGITAGKLVAASANLNFSLTIAAPALPYQVSATVMLSSSLLATATLNMKAMGLVQALVLPGGSPNQFAAFAVWVCRPNVHELNCGAIGSVGI